jgi:hypothetical protein
VLDIAVDRLTREALNMGGPVAERDQLSLGDLIAIVAAAGLKRRGVVR